MARVRSPAIGGRSAGSGALARARSRQTSSAPATTIPASSRRLVWVIRSPTRRSVTTMAKTATVTTPPA
jgi:hypothetical protein